MSAPPVPSPSAIEALLLDQNGVIARWQVLELGGTPSDIARRLRRRECARALPGVFVNHTGTLTWRQRAWAAVLHYWPAALCGDSAARIIAGPGWRHHREEAAIHVAVDVSRNVQDVAGCRVQRLTRLEERVQWNRSPPHLRYDDAVIDLASRAGRALDSIAILADACQSRGTPARRLLDTLDQRQRVPNRAWLRNVLADVAEGTCSALEHGYLTRAERPHGFPAAHRNRAERIEGRACYRDVDYDAVPLIVELDGRLFHDGTGRRDADLDRDLAKAAEAVTVRLSWGQVFERPCRTAARLQRLLHRQGWAGVLHPCSAACPVGANPD